MLSMYAQGEIKVMLLAILDLSDEELCDALEERTMFDVSDLFSSNGLLNIICAVVSFEDISVYLDQARKALWLNCLLCFP